MADMQFENQGEEFGRPPEESSGFDLAGSLISAGLVSSRQEAQIAMIAVAIVALLVGGFIFIRSLGGGSAPPPPPVALAIESRS